MDATLSHPAPCAHHRHMQMLGAPKRPAWVGTATWQGPGALCWTAQADLVLRTPPCVQSSMLHPHLEQTASHTREQLCDGWSM